MAILLVVTNEERHIPGFIKSLECQSFKNHQLYVLDNNCSDESIAIISSSLPGSRIIRQDENVGFARGINLLAEEAISDQHEFLFILNPDIELDTGCIEGLLKLITSDHQLSAVAPIMFFGLEQRDDLKIQSFANFINFKTHYVSNPYGNMQFVEGEYPEEIDVNVVRGGITFIRAEVVQKIGLFEEKYFIYGEEADLALRSSLEGYRMKVTSRARVWHHHDFSSCNKTGNRRQYYYILRSKYLYFIKWKYYKSLINSLLSELLRFPARVYWALKYRDILLLFYYYTGIIHGIRNITGKAKFNFH